MIGNFNYLLNSSAVAWHPYKAGTWCRHIPRAHSTPLGIHNQLVHSGSLGLQGNVPPPLYL